MSDDTIPTDSPSSQKRGYQLKQRAERQAQTRHRIVEATVALHQEVGPASTTVAEIARRAGVSRLTVYNHFPSEGELFAACQQQFLIDNPIPDLTPALGLAKPAERVQALLTLLYGAFRRQAPMSAKVLHDRQALPALDALLARTRDASLAELSRSLAAEFRVKGAAGARLRAVIALALDFWTWQRLAQEGLTDDKAAQLMADLAACVATSQRA
jgi:AcrR family transcriptional regulator